MTLDESAREEIAAAKEAFKEAIFQSDESTNIEAGFAQAAAEEAEEEAGPAREPSLTVDGLRQTAEKLAEDEVDLGALRGFLDSRPDLQELLPEITAATTPEEINRTVRLIDELHAGDQAAELGAELQEDHLRRAAEDILEYGDPAQQWELANVFKDRAPELLPEWLEEWQAVDPSAAQNWAFAERQRQSERSSLQAIFDEAKSQLKAKEAELKTRKTVDQATARFFEDNPQARHYMSSMLEVAKTTGGGMGFGSAEESAISLELMYRAARALDAEGKKNAFKIALDQEFGRLDQHRYDGAGNFVPARLAANSPQNVERLQRLAQPKPRVAERDQAVKRELLHDPVREGFEGLRKARRKAEKTQEQR